MTDLSFWQGRRVFLTGHTGFKGAWLCRILTQAGAVLTGYSLPPPTEPNLFSICSVTQHMTSILGDIRDRQKLEQAIEEARPEVVIHMAAQPLVLAGYEQPVHTYETNVMGTVYLLECIRRCPSVKSVLNVTTDKVYRNEEWAWPYRESDHLGGLDPYSNSKSCSELVTHAYKNSFLDASIAVSTARAGNVIGGGDFSANRIIPDCVRATAKGEAIQVRNPHSIRPYQHVLEPLFAYLLIARRQYETKSLAGYYNVGPNDCDCISTGELADLFCKHWGHGQRWENKSAETPREAGILKLDCSKIKSVLGWKPRWGVDDAVAKTVQWARVYLKNGDIDSAMDSDIAEYANRR